MVKVNRGKRLTSKEAARVLGVSEASVKRWADSGLLPMEKTAGGHRRFRPEDIAVVRRAWWSEEERPAFGQRSAAKIHAQTGKVLELEPGREKALVEETFSSLMDGRDEELSALLVNLRLHGQTVAEIADRFLCVAMRRVGDLWHRGELSVAQEHVATSTAITALRGLEAIVKDAASERRMLALCCSVEEDFHELPVRLAALTLEAGGFEVFNIGTSTPFSALTETIERFRPQLVCVSSTVLFGLDRTAREYTEFHRTAQRWRTLLVLGGAGFADTEVRRRFPANLHAESFGQLEELIAGRAIID